MSTVKMSKMDWEIYEQIKDYAFRLARRKYITAHGGNISVRSGNTMWITRHAASLESLCPEDIIKVRVDKPIGHDLVASTETPVHRAVYQKTGNLCIMHAHPPYTVALSFFIDKLVPLDSEGYHVLKEVPIVEGSPGSPELAEAVADALSKHWAVIVRGHGVFAASKFIDHTYQLLCMVEHSAEIYYLTEMMKAIGGLPFIKPKAF
ncbi:MAG TPA: fuculose phosphate aldolase [Candidatus Methanomethylia archaeon]|nr:fuculose phosphate aldolase [Candidatus Methanomethylicia archaeon]